MNNTHLAILEQLRSNNIFEISFIKMSHYQPEPLIRKQMEIIADYLEFLIKIKPRSEFSQVYSVHKKDSYHISLQYKDGSIASLIFGFFGSKQLIYKFEISSKKGLFVLDSSKDNSFRGDFSPNASSAIPAPRPPRVKKLLNLIHKSSQTNEVIEVIGE